MTLTFRSISPFGAEFSGLVDPANPTPQEAEQLSAALTEHGVLVAHGLDLSPQDQVELSRVFGEPEIHPMELIRHPEVPELIELKVDLTDIVSPGDPDADEIVADIPWHADLTYVREPSYGSLLYARDVPPVGGDTLWVDMAHVYSILPDELRKRIAGLEARHSLEDGRIAEYSEIEDPSGQLSTGDFDAVVQPLVHRHPITGTPILNISPAFNRGIVGMSQEESDALLGELEAIATREERIFRQRWSVGDLVVWDNLRTMHLASGHPKRYRRYLTRTQLRGQVLVAA